MNDFHVQSSPLYSNYSFRRYQIRRVNISCKKYEQSFQVRIMENWKPSREYNQNGGSRRWVGRLTVE